MAMVSDEQATVGLFQAQKDMEIARISIQDKNYKEATTWLKSALNHFPQLKQAFEMLIISETLYYHTTTPQPDWYSVLHLHPSSSPSEVQTQCDLLIKSTKLMESELLPGAKDALGVLNQAKSVLCDEHTRLEYDNKRKGYGLVDLCSLNKRGSFREDYLGWEAPTCTSDVVDVVVDVEQLHSRKRGMPIANASPSTPQCVVDGDSALSPEVKKLKHQMFDEMPQSPHFAPLEKYSSKVRRGMMIGLDLAFINLCEEISNLEDPKMFWFGFDDFMKQVSELEEMGYNMEKVRDRLEMLKGIAGRDRVCREQVEEFEAEKKQHEAKIVDLQELVLKLKEKIEMSKELMDKNLSRIDVLEKETVETVKEFASTAKSSWTGR